MKAIMVMFDTLSRRYLPNYGCEWTEMPNFKRLGEKTVTFDNFYVGSLPCMPARRELHTGRLNFLHRGWTPLEPFDDSMPELLKNNNVYSHLITDHQHYWEDGGATYHNRYSSYEFIRGQEGDLWKGVVKDPAGLPLEYNHLPSFVKAMKRQDIVNRTFMKDEEDHTQARSFAAGLEFLERNHEDDNWFLQLECFDPHEPFFVPDRFKKDFEDSYEGPDFDWPAYGSSSNITDEKMKRGRNNYAALMAMCDFYLGKVIDFMDNNDMWKDTMLIVNTDHGFLMGEKEWAGKSVMPTYNEIAHTPFFIWDPRFNIKGVRRTSLGQTIDIAPTILDFFEINIPKDMQGKPLNDIIKEDEKIREHLLFGYHGGHVNITDGKHVYMRSCIDPSNQPLNEYTLMPMNMRNLISPKTLANVELCDGFSFTKGAKLLKFKPEFVLYNPFLSGNMLFNLESDPSQLNPIIDYGLEVKLINEMTTLMKENDSPLEQYERLGLSIDDEAKVEMVVEQNTERENVELAIFNAIGDVNWEDGVKLSFLNFYSRVARDKQQGMLYGFKSYIDKNEIKLINKQIIVEFLKVVMPKEMIPLIMFIMASEVKRR